MQGRHVDAAVSRSDWMQKSTIPWMQRRLKYVADFFNVLGRTLPPSLIADIEAAASPAPPPRRPEPAATPEGTETATKPKRLKRGDAALMICAALNSLAREGKWNVAEKEIMVRAGVPKSTYYRALKHNDDVKEKMHDYHARRLGRGPARSRDI
jgi:hypothetical protein